MISAKFATLFIERCFRIGKGTQMWVPMLESVLWERRTNVSLEIEKTDSNGQLFDKTDLYALPGKGTQLCFPNKTDSIVNPSYHKTWSFASL